MPVGELSLGRLFNVIGDPIDGKPFPADAPRASIHREAPPFKEQRTKAEVFETGIKSIDLLAPFIRGGKVGLFGSPDLGGMRQKDVTKCVESRESGYKKTENRY